jgi:hypothetical protein
VVKVDKKIKATNTLWFLSCAPPIMPVESNSDTAAACHRPLLHRLHRPPAPNPTPEKGESRGGDRPISHRRVSDKVSSLRGGGRWLQEVGVRTLCNHNQGALKFF